MLEKCLEDVKTGRISHQAENVYNIPRRTITNKPKLKHSQKPGWQPIFSTEEEEELKNCILSVSQFGFPVNSFDLQLNYKDLLVLQRAASQGIPKQHPRS
jgi:hypothetical protein